ncbi:MAG: glycosyl transferase group 1, partial [Bacteroidetes bacterium]|nr:glycosyl transferase group 1 [Bacteroidota bacterium]
GLSGLMANLQRKVPVITTYHGSDINNNAVFRFSKWSIRLSFFNIFVSLKNFEKANHKNNSTIIPCGIDTDLFSPSDKNQSRNKLSFTSDEKLVLFAGAFDNPVKNSSLPC